MAASESPFGFNGVERELVEDLTFSATVIGKWEKNIIDDVDAAHLDLNKLRTTGIGNVTNWNWFKTTAGQRVYSIMGPRYVQFGLIYRF